MGNTLKSCSNKLSSRDISPPPYEGISYKRVHNTNTLSSEDILQPYNESISSEQVHNTDNLSYTLKEIYPINILIIKKFGVSPYRKLGLDTPNELEKLIGITKVIYEKGAHAIISVNKKLDLYVEFSQNSIFCDFLREYSKYRFTYSLDQKKKNWKLRLVVNWEGYKGITQWNNNVKFFKLSPSSAIRFSDELLIDIDGLLKFMKYFENHKIFKNGDQTKNGNSVKFDLVSPNESNGFSEVTPSEILYHLDQ